MSNFKFICRTIFVSDRSFSRLFPSENTQFLLPEECQYLLTIHCLDLLGCLLLAQCQSIFQIIESILLNILLDTTVCRIKKNGCPFSLFSEPYVKLSFHTAQAFYNPLFGQQLFVMVTVSGLHIFFALSTIFVATSVSFLIP